MTHIIVDVETDGPIFGENSMICFGAVVLDEKLNKTFYGQCRPGNESSWIPEALAVSGFTREETLKFQHPAITMTKFAEWIETVNTSSRPILWSDNNQFDASWIDYYFNVHIGKNPFGWSSRRIGDVFSGFENHPYYRWKRHRKTKHTHNPVDDAMGNAEAMMYLINKGFKLKI